MRSKADRRQSMMMMIPRSSSKHIKHKAHSISKYCYSFYVVVCTDANSSKICYETLLGKLEAEFYDLAGQLTCVENDVWLTA
jgi:hypothetical protein